MGRRKRNESSEDDEPQVVVSSSQLKGLKKKKMGAPIEKEDLGIMGVKFKSSGTAQSLVQDTATRTLDVDGLDGAILDGEKAEQMDGIYNGMSQYKEFVNKRTAKVTQQNAGGLRAGPLKGLSGVKISSRFDYAPAICKDYKDTGFCGFGDSCVFMHDRGDYKMGWEIDKEWDEEQKKKAEDEDKKRNSTAVIELEVESDDDLPFACLICRKDFVDPVVTKCQHYFCQSCAFKQFKKTPGCFACNLNTMGVFNVAREFKIKLAAKKERMAQRERKIKSEIIDSQDVNLDE